MISCLKKQTFEQLLSGITIFPREAHQCGYFGKIRPLLEARRQVEDAARYTRIPSPPPK